MQHSPRGIPLSAFAFTLPWIALTISPWAQTVNEETKLVASDAANLDQFGVGISVSGDTAVVGAPNHDHAGGADAGSAYVVVRAGTSWTEQAQLVASDADDFDLFGTSTAIFGDTAVVGARRDNHAGGIDAGSAYVFVRAGTSWTEQAKLVASDASTVDNFGVRVAIEGDTAVVGASNDDPAGETDAGSVYVFVRVGTSWTEQAKLVASDAAAFDMFGMSLAISGETLVVGAFKDDLFTGSAYVFVRAGTSWTEQAKLVASDGLAGDQLGSSVSISGDTVVAGGFGDDHSEASAAGSAYAFVRVGTIWTEQAKLVASDAATDDNFGISIAISGDTAVVGSFTDDHSGGTDAGSAYVYVRSGTSWTERAKLVASDAADLDNFGARVFVSGDTALVGAPNDDHAGGTDAGSVYVYCLAEIGVAAGFTGSPTSGSVPLAVAFTDTSSGSVTTWDWDFGDGGTSTLQNPAHTYTLAGTYTVTLTATGPDGSDSETKTNYITVSDPPTGGAQYYLSFSTTTTVPGLGTVEDEDVVIFDAGTGVWSWYFDGSDVGLTSEVDAIHLLADGDIVLSVDTDNTSIAGLTGGPNGTLIDDSDLVIFDVTSSGSTTAGTFSFTFDGSDVGLTTANEDVDAVYEFPGGGLGISILGSGAVTGVSSVQDEDVLFFAASLYGSTTTGTWSMQFDGSDVGFSTTGGEDIDAVSFDNGVDMLFSTLDAYSASGGAGESEDVSRFVGTFGSTTTGTASLVLDLSALGIDASENVDGLFFQP